MRVGFHISIRFGLAKVPRAARERRCSTIQVFSRPPQNWRLNTLAEEDVAAFRAGLAEHDIRPVVIHTQYLLNLGTSERTLRRRTIRSLQLDLQRARVLGAAFVVTHIGSARGGRRSAALKRVALAIDAALAEAPPGVMLLLENSAGAGSLLGHSPEELADVVGASRHPERLGVCIDTAHAFAAGHRITSAAGLDDFLALLDRTLTPDRVKLVHLNDSKAAFGSHVDRHWHIGKGEMGRRGLGRIVNHPRLRDLPFIMETPEADLRHDRMNMRAFERLLRPATRRAEDARHRPAEK